MPKFHFHLYENADPLLDPEGIDCDVNSLAERTLTAARAAVLASAAPAASTQSDQLYSSCFATRLIAISCTL